MSDDMRGVWMLRGEAVALVGRVDPPECRSHLPVGGSRLGWHQYWEGDGTFFARSHHEYDLVDRLGPLDDLRSAADELMRLRRYAAAAVLYQLLGDAGRVADAVRGVREVREAEADRDAERPF